MLFASSALRSALCHYSSAANDFLKKFNRRYLRTAGDVLPNVSCSWVDNHTAYMPLCPCDAGILTFPSYQPTKVLNEVERHQF